MQIQTGYKQEFFYGEGGETSAQIDQRDGGCSIPGNVQDQVGWESEQPDLVEDVPAHCRRVGIDVFQKSLQTQAIL